MDGRMESDFGVTRVHLGDGEEVCAASFFNLGAGCWVEIHIFSKSCFVCFLAGVEAHGVVEACFDMTGAVWGCAVKIGNGDLDRFDAALEIWPTGMQIMRNSNSGAGATPMTGPLP